MIVGAFEVVSFPRLDIDGVVAKIDTGAYSGAVYCSDIILSGEAGKRTLTFKVLGESHVIYQNKFKKVRVRSASGHEEVRFLIDTTIELKGEKYPIQIGLADRNKLKYPILIGRRFLRQNNILVDPRINEEFDKGEDRIR